MKYKEFIEELTEHLQERLGTGYMVIPNESLGLNGKIKHSIIIKGKDSNVAPCVFLNDFYQEYTDGKIGIAHAAEKVLNVYWENEIRANLDTECFTDWNLAKRGIRCMLVNTEKNVELLAKIPHREILDLSVIYYIQFAVSGGFVGVVHIRNEYMELWNVNEDTLYNEAWTNTQEADDVEYNSLENIVGQTLGMGTKEIGLLDQHMYILTNRQKLYGAVYMLSQDRMMKIADVLCSDLWIIPSSIHESIIIPCGWHEHAEELAKIVCEINDTELLDNEVLSYHVYHFSRNNGEISIAA